MELTGLIKTSSIYGPKFIDHKSTRSELKGISYILDGDRHIGETVAITADELPGAPDLSVSAAFATKALLPWAETNFKKTSHFASLPEYKGLRSGVNAVRLVHSLLDT